MAGISRRTTEFRWVNFPSPDYLPSAVNAELLFHTATLVGKWIYVLGPTEPARTTTRRHFCRLDTASEKWEWILVEGPYLQYHSTFLCGDAMFIYGGEQNDKSHSNSVWRFDLVLHNWLKFQVNNIRNSPNGLESFSSGFIEKRQEFVVCCGEKASGELENKTWAFQLADAKWRVPAVKGHLPGRRAQAACCSREDCVFIYGGIARGVQLNDLHVLDCSSRRFHWSQLLVAPGLPRSNATLSYVNGRLLLFGGMKSQHDACSELFVIDLSEENIQLKELTPEWHSTVEDSRGTAGHAAVYAPSGLHIVGGIRRYLDNVQILRGRN